jgi:hypothetical protein
MKHLLITTIAAVVLVTTAFAGPIHNAARDGNVEGFLWQQLERLDNCAQRD